MTGIEKLRMTAEIHRGNGSVFMATYLSDIADQIEREHSEDSEAAAWVREHGGLGSVQARVDTLQDTLDWLREHAGVGKDELVDYDELLDALDRRLMPEGYEWPRYEDGEMVIVGEYGVNQVDFYSDGLRTVWGNGVKHENLLRGERVRRPSALAADGEPLEVGQTVWHVATGRKYTVRSCTNGGAHLSRGGKPAGYCRADYLTHQRPVLDADGVPIREGDTVYWLEHTAPFTVVSPHETRDNAGRELECGHTVEVMRDGHELHMYVHPESLHHTKPEPPDSWERIEEDCAKSDVDYCAERGLLDPSCDAVEGDGSTRHCTDCGCTCGEKMARDLVRRCRALAERERGE